MTAQGRTIYVLFAFRRARVMGFTGRYKVVVVVDSTLRTERLAEVSAGSLRDLARALVYMSGDR